MEIVFDNNNYTEEIENIIYYNYRMEFQHFEEFPNMTKNAFHVFLKESLKDFQKVIALEENKCVGVLFYSIWEDEENRHCLIPSYGYGSVKNRDKCYISYLFQNLANTVVNEDNREVQFHINLYAHDREMQELFSFMEFGFQAEIGIQKINNCYEANTEYCIKELSKSEIVSRWEDVWKLTKAIIDHLKTSPIFYPGKEFTEELYREFYLDDATNVFAAFDKSENMIGIIENNLEDNALALPDVSSVNVGEVYVLPDYRGSGLAQDLLMYSEKTAMQRGIHWAWVEHGTANPNARGFWNKYFSTYQYEMIRNVKKCV